ncbi:unnamed protein product [Rotaria sordida]|uniref:Uncharacterized protein n=1 Tax=Rotaria sordida TaxID=392033 RepID=A0A818TLE0_9BILA|nr:unnamed protein product [Rotaria sordida]CAF1336780.1 unnamed protein product [Rotaria sordida]CAF1394430.1 unnamed protein product [Rotaria sordida]CAF1575532.1 unnamed protein product [Rotaria sordida]CAF1575688.1 unnamed protein product [Rotaria sordida]
MSNRFLFTSTVNDDTHDKRTKDDHVDESQSLLIVKNDDQVDIVVMDDDTGLSVIKRDVGLVTIVFVLVVVYFKLF